MKEISFEEQCKLDEIRFNQKLKAKRKILPILDGFTFNEIMEILDNVIYKVKALSTLNYEEDSQQK